MGKKKFQKFFFNHTHTPERGKKNRKEKGERVKKRRRK
jgi:hypothetical protein